MAVALKVKYFTDPVVLATFCSTVGNNVTTVVSIVFDANRRVHVLYYT